MDSEYSKRIDELEATIRDIKGKVQYDSYDDYVVGTWIESTFQEIDELCREALGE